MHNASEEPNRRGEPANGKPKPQQMYPLDYLRHKKGKPTMTNHTDGKNLEPAKARAIRQALGMLAATVKRDYEAIRWDD